LLSSKLKRIILMRKISRRGKEKNTAGGKNSAKCCENREKIRHFSAAFF